MKIIGLTGGIGAGKSVVSRILRCNGMAVYDCDSEAKRIMDSSEWLAGEIETRFSPECVWPDGSLNRKEIAVHVFGDDSKRLWLNSVVHQMVREDILRLVNEREATDCNPSGASELLFIESAILNTSGLTEMCDTVWLVTASLDTRIERIRKRDGLTKEDITRRIESQKGEFADFCGVRVEIIENNDNSCVLDKILELLNRELR